MNSYHKCTAKQRIYIDCRLGGMTKVASAAAAGSSDATNFEVSETVQAAFIERMQATADEVDFDRKDAHDMYMDAYRNAETATEQIAAVTAMVKLHGLEKPRVIEHKHSQVKPDQLEYMSMAELQKLAGMDGLTLEGEFNEITETPKLAPPEATDGNTKHDAREVPDLSKDY